MVRRLAPRALPPSLVTSEDKNQSLRADAQRIILAAMRWVDADSAVDDEALAKLLKGRRLRASFLVQRRLLRVLPGQPP